MDIQGYMIEVGFDGQTLRVHGTNKASRAALVGQDHANIKDYAANSGGDLVLTRERIAGVDLKDASMMVNGNLRVTTVDGKTYQLHFRKKQAEDFRALAAQLRG